MTDTREFSGAVVLVTGAARGQGRSHALGFAERGATVIALDLCEDIDTIPYPLATAEDLAETARLIELRGGRCHPVRADVRDSARMRDVVEQAVDEFGSLDICVANAGVVSFAEVCEIDDRQWSTMIDVNLTGVFHTVQAAGAVMRGQGRGRIITIASMGGRGGAPNLGHYAAAKWGVIGLTKTLALELAEAGVTANVICPGTVSTDMVHNPAMYGLFAPDLADPDQAQVEGRYAQLNPMRTPWTDPQDITAAVLYLASDAAKHVSGITLEISAGTSARMP